MRTKLLVAVAVVLVGGAFLFGYLPQRTRRATAEAQSALLQERLTAAEARVRAGELLGQVLTVKEVAMRQNYGLASERSSAFFDAVRTEVPITPHSALRDAMNEVLAQRDIVTAALAKGEPSVVETLHDIELRLRRALGLSMPPEPVSTP
jgi:type II secretory pathway pseudopilin PulG